MLAELVNNEYRAVTRWRVQAAPGELATIAQTPEDLMRWWPAAFLVSEMTKPGDGSGVGAEFECHTKGWLPHTFHFQGRVVEAVYGRKVRVVVWGDFEGSMECGVEQAGTSCRIQFDWRVRVEKPLIRRLSFLFKALFYCNHMWVMNCGLKSIEVELARRRSARVRRVAPGPTFPYGPRYQWLRKGLPR